MSVPIVGRQLELSRIGAFLDSLRDGPAALFLCGEPGIGKTTLWQAGVGDARRRGYQVLANSASQAEARLSYSSLADLLAGVDDQTLSALPAPQREALEIALLQRSPMGSTPDHRAIATGLLNVLLRLASRAPVVLAVDDLQWLDSPSADALGFAARRLSGQVGVLASVRIERGDEEIAAIRLANSDRLSHVDIGPLSLASLHGLLKERTGRAFPRPALVRIQSASGGNPFFALELVRVLGEELVLAPSVRFPRTLAELAQTHVRGLDARVQELLLAAAALAHPTVDLLQTVIGPETPELLERAEALDVAEIDGGRLRFTHPLLASGVYAMASAAQRRAMHRRLAGAGLAIEERARHLALAAMTADPETIVALDEAAAHARGRGAAGARRRPPASCWSLLAASGRTMRIGGFVRPAITSRRAIRCGPELSWSRRSRSSRRATSARRP